MHHHRAVALAATHGESNAHTTTRRPSGSKPIPAVRASAPRSTSTAGTSHAPGPYDRTSPACMSAIHHRPACHRDGNVSPSTTTSAV